MTLLLAEQLLDAVFIMPLLLLLIQLSIALMPVFLVVVNVVHFVMLCANLL
jgi:hypothetical protein